MLSLWLKYRDNLELKRLEGIQKKDQHYFCDEINV